MNPRGKIAQIAWRSEDDESSLKAAYQQEKDHQIKPKLHLLWLVRQGKQIQEAAATVGVNNRTGQRWIACYRQGGLAAIHRRKRAGKGKASYLSVEQKQRLKEWANAGNLESTPDALAFVAKEFGIAYSESGLYKQLVALRLKKKVPRPQNAKASQEVQEAFKKGA
jgi:transposase